MNPRRFATLLAVFATAALLAGCGSSSSSTESSSSSGSSASGETTKPAADGKAIFASAGCASCHTLKAAGSHGTSGPDLTDIKASKAVVVKQVENGGGGMPAFKSSLSPEEIDAVSDFVVSNDGS